MHKHLFCRGYLAAILTLTVTLCAAAGNSPAEQPALMHEFLLDSYAVKQSSNIARAPIVARKFASNPVLSPEAPWETGHDRVGLPSIFVDEEEKLRMLYWTTKSSNLLGNICAAESTDGYNWERTLLDKYPSGTGAPTQIVIDDGDLPSPYTQTTTMWVLENPKPDLLPDSKYLGLIEMRDPRNTFIVTSANGIDWDLDNRYLVTNIKDDTFASLVHGPDGKFRAYVRGTNSQGRVVDMIESTDLQHWSNRTTIMEGNPDHQIYGMEVQKIDGVYVSLMSVYHYHEPDANGNGFLDDELVYSRDAVDFKREFPLTPSLPRGNAGEWDYGMAYYNSGIIQWDDRWIVAYTGGEEEHGSSSPLDIGIAEFDRGRLIRNAQVDPGSAATIETNLMVMGGGELLVNADLAGGTLRVGVVDGAGNFLQGYGSGDAMLSVYDDLRYLVTWTSSATLPSAGQYGLRFELGAGASLYAYELAAEYVNDVCPPLTGNLIVWDGDIDGDWNKSGNWSIWEDQGVIIADPACTPPTITQTVRITDAAPATIGQGTAATANELQVGRLADRTVVGATLNITGGSLILGGDQFTLWGGGDGVFVNQTGGTVYLGSRADLVPVMVIANYAGGTATYTLNGADARLIAAQGNRIIDVGMGSGAQATFDHIQGAVRTGTLQVAAHIHHVYGTGFTKMTAIYNLEADGILQIDKAILMGVPDQDSNTGTFNFHGGTLTRDFVGDPDGHTDLTLRNKVSAPSNRHLVFQGYGTVDFGPGTLTNNDTVRADSLGVSGRVLDMSCFSAVANTVENVFNTFGWYAVNEGKLILPSISVAAGNGAYNWGESADDAQIDLVNSLCMELTGVTAGSAGDVSISLLAADRDSIDYSQTGVDTLVGVWKFDDSLSFDTADLTFRYDHQATADALIAKWNLKIFSSDDGTTWTELSAAVDTTNMLVETQVSGGFADYYALGGSAQPILPGDANEDRVVDAIDAAVLAANWLATGAVWSKGDFNGDGVVNDIDATLMAANWSTTDDASVPEPATLFMLAMIGLCCFTDCRIDAVKSI